MTMMILPMIKNLGRSSWSFWVNNKDDDIILKHLNTMDISMNVTTTTTKKNIWWCLYLETQRNSPPFPIVFIIIVLIARFWDGFNIHTHTQEKYQRPRIRQYEFFFFTFFSFITHYLQSYYFCLFVKKESYSLQVLWWLINTN